MNNIFKISLNICFLTLSEGLKNEFESATVNEPLVFELCITKTRLYNFDPLKPHFYIVKLGFTGVYIIFLISSQNINCEYSLKPPRRVVLTSTHNLCFEKKYEKYQTFLSENFPLFGIVKFSIYLNRRVFVMKFYITKKKKKKKKKKKIRLFKYIENFTTKN